MGEDVVMDFDDYLSKLSNEQKQLLKAVESGTVARVTDLFTQQRNINQGDELFNYILLVTALRRKCKTLIKYLIKEDCPVRVAQKTGYHSTPLYYAVNIGDIEIFRALYNRKASVFDKDVDEDTPLELAMVKNESQMITWVLNDVRLHGESKNLKPDCERHVALFHAACWIGDLRAIKMFISAQFSMKCQSSFNQDDWKGFTPLHFTLQRTSRLTDAVERFLKIKDIDLFVQDEKGRTPLNLAFRNDNRNLFRSNIVIQHLSFSREKQFVNPADEEGLNHFHIVCSIQFPPENLIKQRKLIKFYIDNQVDVNRAISFQDANFPGYTALRFVVERSCWGIFNLLLENGADPRIADEKGLTPLHLVCSCDKIDRSQRLLVIKSLLQYGADPLAKDSEDRTPLHYAFSASSGSRPLDEFEKLLFSKNENHANHTDKNGISFLHIACTGDDYELVKNLIANGARVNACVNEDSLQFAGYSALYFAVKFHQLKTVELLLAQGANVNWTSKKNTNLLHLACYHRFDQWFYPEKRRRVNASDIDWLPSRSNHVRMIEILIGCGIAIDEVDKSSNSTPLLNNFSIPDILNQNFPENLSLYLDMKYELIKRQKLVMGMLLDHGANIKHHSNEGSVFHILAKNDLQSYPTAQLMRIALDKGADVDAVDQINGLTPLLVAVHGSLKQGHRSSLVALLLEYGANINGKSKKNSNTCLHIVARSYSSSSVHERVLDMLLDHPEIEVDARNNLGQTPLQLAIEQLNHYCVEKLLAFGADINSEDYRKFSPLYTFSKGCSEEFNNWSGDRKKVVTSVVTHVEKLTRLKLHVKEKIRNSVISLSHRLPQDNLALIESKLDEEIEYLKSRKLDSYNSWYDILLKDPNAMSKHVLNKEFREEIASILENPGSTHFGIFMKRQYQIGLRRSKVLEPAKSALNAVTSVAWPHSCSEEILSYLTNKSLKDLIESASSQNVLKRADGNLACHAKSTPKQRRLEKSA